MLLIAALPAYLIRFNIFGLPSTLLEVMIWAVFLVWAVKNFSRVKGNFLNNFKKGDKKIKVRYPFDWEIVLLLLIAFTAAGVAGFSSSSFGIFKAYFFEPVILFIVALNIMKGEKGREKILWALAVSALAVSALAIYQKITGQLIGNPLWAAASTRRVVSFFGYPNAVGLYLGPIVLVMTGWFFSVIARSRALGETTKQSLFARNDIIVIIFIKLTIIASLLSIYFARSKGALLGVVVGLMAFGLMAGKKIRWATLAIIIIATIGIAVYQPARDLAVENITFANKSGQIRKAGWADTLKMLKDDRLLTGAGLANFQAAVAPYHTQGIFIKDSRDPDAQRKLVFNEAYRTAHWQPLEIYLYPHNIVLNFWSELGLAGVLLFIWIIGKYFYLGALSLRGSASDRSNPRLEATNQRLLRSLRSLAMTDKYLVIGLICAMVAIVVHGIVDVPYFKNDLAAMFWLLAAMMSLINLEKNYGKNL
jgi:O-antigen ligase